MQEVCTFRTNKICQDKKPSHHTSSKVLRASVCRQIQVPSRHRINFNCIYIYNDTVEDADGLEDVVLLKSINDDDRLLKVGRHEQ